MRPRRAPACAALLGSVLLSGCQLFKEPPPVPFEIVIRVESDPGVPVQDAALMKGGKEGPHTGADGTVDLKMTGKEGESVDLNVKCPANYNASGKPITISLRRISSGKLPEYTSHCIPTFRRLVVAVRADSGGGLPVRTPFGQVLGRTDGAGAFTYSLVARPGDTIYMVLDTTEPGFERINPKNPGGTFTVKPYDDIVTFDQRFKWDPIPIHYVKPKERPKPILPKHVDY
jgi:hypothetical protein